MRVCRIKSESYVSKNDSIENFWFHDGFGKISDEKGSVIKKL